MRSIRKQLADERLGVPVEDWLRERRDAGISWDDITYEFRDAAAFKATSTTLRTWLAEADGQQARAS